MENCVPSWKAIFWSRCYRSVYSCISRCCYIHWESIWQAGETSAQIVFSNKTQVYCTHLSVSKNTWLNKRLKSFFFSYISQSSKFIIFININGKTFRCLILNPIQHVSLFNIQYIKGVTIAKYNYSIKKISDNFLKMLAFPIWRMLMSYAYLHIFHIDSSSNKSPYKFYDVSLFHFTNQ